MPWTFVDCQWVVHVKCQYYAQKRMKKALKRKDGEKAGADAVVVPTVGRRKLSTMASVTLAAQVQDRAAAEQLQADLLTALEVEQASKARATSRSEARRRAIPARNSQFASITVEDSVSNEHVLERVEDRWRGRPCSRATSASRSCSTSVRPRR